MADPPGPRSPERLSPADLLTIGNGVLGFLAIALVARAWADGGPGAGGLSQGELALAAGLIGAGTLLDVLDGLAARLWGSSGLGAHFDSMADTITFGLAPAFLLTAHGSGLASPWDAVTLAAASGYVVVVMIRLARNAAGLHVAPDSFCGMTSPVGAVALIALIAVDASPLATVAGVVAISGGMLARFAYPHQRQAIPTLILLAAWPVGAAAVAGVIPLRTTAALGLAVILAIPLLGRRRRALGERSPLGARRPSVEG